ncbi:MAG: hypothetical protein WD876_01295 [Candidatus Pacearchaeota archaeon]
MKTIALVILGMILISLTFISAIPDYYWTFDDGGVAYFKSVPTSNPDIWTSKRISLINKNLMCIP